MEIITRQKSPGEWEWVLCDGVREHCVSPKSYARRASAKRAADRFAELMSDGQDIEVK